MENKNYALDSIDDRDYLYEDIVGVDNIKMPKYKVIDRLDDYQNQGLEKITKYMCVFYSSGHGNNIQNYLSDSDVFIKCKELGLKAIDKGYLDVNLGAYIYSGPKLLKELEYINGYGLVKTLEQIKHSIYNDRPVATGSNKYKIGKDNILYLGKSYGHAFLIIGYDDAKQLLICKNSYGKNRFDNGRMYIRYSDINRILYNSKYSLIDKKESMKEYKKNILKKLTLNDTKLAFLIGLTNGKNMSKEKQETFAGLVRVIRFTNPEKLIKVERELKEYLSE